MLVSGLLGGPPDSLASQAASGLRAWILPEFQSPRNLQNRPTFRVMEKPKAAAYQGLPNRTLQSTYQGR